MNFQEPLSGILERIASGLERLGPGRPGRPDFAAAEAFVWQPESGSFEPITDVNRVKLSLLKGIDRMRDTLFANTLRFAQGLPANNALLWGARGMGKSALIKAIHHEIAGLKLVEIHREDLATLPRALAHMRANPDLRFILFCDDLSFEASDTTYKSLKAVLEGGIEGRPANVVFYATSNRRHLMPRAAAARAASPGNTSRTSPAGLERGSRAYSALAAWSLMCLVGSTGREPLRSSKCTCGEVTAPVAPALAMIWPRRTFSPRLTRSSSLLA